MKATRLRLKRWVVTSMYIFAISLATLSLMYVSKTLKTNQEGDTLSYVFKGFINDEVPVVSLTNETIIKPFDSETVTINKNFYDRSADNATQENSLIYYQNTYMPNTGILYTNNEEFEVIATLEGTVSKITKDELLGNVVEITHTSNLTTTYYSLNNVNVVEGQTLKQNDVIGTSGKNNISSTSDYMMLFEVSLNGTNIDPENYYNMKIEDLNN